MLVDEERIAALAELREHERRKYLKLLGTSYGSSNHGGAALPLVRLLNPGFVVDFGCGDNSFIRTLRRDGIGGLGIDFANPLADCVAPMHAVPIGAAVADVVTSFDALEHVLPDDVEAVFAEMRRIARPGAAFGFSICTVPSKILVEGENLHPTVRKIEWWENEIERVGEIESRGRYLQGRFR